MRRSSPRGHLTGDVDVVLDRDRDTEKWEAYTGVESKLGVNGFGAGALRSHGAKSVEFAVETSDALEVQLE